MPYELRLLSPRGKVLRTVISELPWEWEWSVSADGEHGCMLWKGDGITILPSDHMTVEAEGIPLEAMAHADEPH